MSLSNDYFLLYHGISFQKNLELEPLDVILDDNTFTIFALIISANRKNYDKYLNLNSFKKLCEQINIKTPSNINEFHNIQNSIVELIHEKSSKNFRPKRSHKNSLSNGFYWRHHPYCRKRTRNVSGNSRSALPFQR